MKYEEKIESEENKMTKKHTQNQKERMKVLKDFYSGIESNENSSYKHGIFGSLNSFGYNNSELIIQDDEYFIMLEGNNGSRVQVVLPENFTKDDVLIETREALESFDADEEFNELWSREFGERNGFSPSDFIEKLQSDAREFEEAAQYLQGDGEDDLAKLWKEAFPFGAGLDELTLLRYDFKEDGYHYEFSDDTTLFVEKDDEKDYEFEFSYDREEGLYQEMEEDEILSMYLGVATKEIDEAYQSLCDDEPDLAKRNHLITQYESAESTWSIELDGNRKYQFGETPDTTHENQKQQKGRSR